MVARIYRWSKSSQAWWYADTFEHDVLIDPTENLLKAWLETDFGVGYSREYTPERWLVVPDSVNHRAGEFKAEWVRPRITLPPPELQVTKVVSH